MESGTGERDTRRATVGKVVRGGELVRGGAGRVFRAVDPPIVRTDPPLLKVVGATIPTVARRRNWSVGRIAILLSLLPLLLIACSQGGSDEATPTPPATATATASPSPSPSPSPTVTSSPPKFIPPTVAVDDDDSIQSCLERNITPELMISLSMDDTDLTEDIMETCLETTIPSEFSFLLRPIVEDASECALNVSKTLSNEELITLADDDSAERDAITDRVTSDVLACLGEKYSLGIFQGCVVGDA